jgi:hypothetical protein
MPAQDHLQPKQLQMFMRPKELKGLLTGSVDGSHSTGAVWLEKKSDNEGTILSQSILQHGIRKPVVIKHSARGAKDTPGAHAEMPFTMGNGHHRVQAADDIEEQTGKHIYIPVVHSKDSIWGQSINAEHDMEDS